MSLGALTSQSSNIAQAMKTIDAIAPVYWTSVRSTGASMPVLCFQAMPGHTWTTEEDVEGRLFGSVDWDQVGFKRLIVPFAPRHPRTGGLSRAIAIQLGGV
jgi:hypothetical protein